jgi:hypothetical protein
MVRSIPGPPGAGVNEVADWARVFIEGITEFGILVMAPYLSESAVFTYAKSAARLQF